MTTAVAAAAAASVPYTVASLLAASAAASAGAGAGGAGSASSVSQRNPSDFLKTALGRPVSVKLVNGIVYKGVLACLDGYMNVSLEQTEEYVHGRLTSKLGDCFIRGNNIYFISAQKRRKAAGL